MASAAGAFRSNGRRRQLAVLAAARRRRRSLAALPKLHQTLMVPIGGPFPDAVTVLQDPTAPVTLKTRIICDGVPSGPLITVGTGGTGLSFVAGRLRAAVGGAYVESDLVFAAGMRFDVALAIVPATGRFRAYVESQEVVDGLAAPGAIVAAGDLELADAGVVLDEGLRLYALHVPQELLGTGGQPAEFFDDLLFRASAHLMGDDQLTPIHTATP